MENQLEVPNEIRNETARNPSQNQLRRVNIANNLGTLLNNASRRCGLISNGKKVEERTDQRNRKTITTQTPFRTIIPQPLPSTLLLYIILRHPCQIQTNGQSIQQPTPILHLLNIACQIIKTSEVLVTSKV